MAAELMTQDEHWMKNYKETLEFMETHHRRPSKHYDEERNMHNWWKQQKKNLNAGRMPAERVMLFNQLLALGEQYHHVNQYK